MDKKKAPQKSIPLIETLAKKLPWIVVGFVVLTVFITILQLALSR